eukprot:TRINITY_DN7625_c0_g3_i1.p1 TRINITY_DN7625_c0_g3~~TRINITY_DN7625_c0_g3_i1.p1  ORF type:complete len:112 (-),score=21.01 TRINITY_DN7625_c0_g3_i1:17-352(-)
MYEGEFLCGEPDGQGVMILEDGAIKVEGEFREGYVEGYATLTSKTGKVYTGYLLQSIKHGHGVMKYEDGRLYDGEWLSGKEEGYGTMTYPDGIKKQGLWKAGVFIKSQDES